jgi:hypothetical protein
LPYHCELSESVTMRLGPFGSLQQWSEAVGFCITKLTPAEVISWTLQSICRLGCDGGWTSLAETMVCGES